MFWYAEFLKFQEKNFVLPCIKIVPVRCAPTRPNYLRFVSTPTIDREPSFFSYKLQPRKAMQKRAELMEKTGKEPTVGDIARAMGLKEEEVVFALEAVIEPVSLYEPVFHDDGDATYVIDQIRDNTAGEGKWLDSIALQEGMERLSERERKILRLRYYACKTQMEVSQEIGISQAQVSRIEKSALKQLEKYM